MFPTRNEAALGGLIQRLRKELALHLTSSMVDILRTLRSKTEV